MAIVNQVLLSWIDQDGHPATTFWTTLDQADAVPAGLNSLGSLAAACTTAGLVAVTYQTTHFVGGTGSGGDYPNINDRVVMYSRVPATGQPRRFELPCPKSSLFLANTTTLDLSNADLIAFQNQAIAMIGDTNGNPVGPIIRGNRQRARGD